MIKEAALTLLAFSGLFFGYLLAYLAKEEVNISRKYLEWLRRGIAILAGALFIYFSWSNITLLVTFAIGIIICIIIKKEFFYLGLLMSLAFFLHNGFLLLFSSLLFIYACLYGILIEKQRWKIFYVNLALFLLPFLLVGIEYMVSSYTQIFFVALLVGISKLIIIRREFRKIR